MAEGEGVPASGDWGGAPVTARPFPRPTQGRFTIAAKHHISIAEIYETELVDIEKVSGSQALPGRRRPGGLPRPVLWDWGSSLSCPLGGVLWCLSTREGAWGTGSVPGRSGPTGDKGCIGATLLPSHPVSPQAIAHYEQSADYYKSEESNRYPGPSPLLPAQPPGAGDPAPTSLFSVRPTQLSQQVSAEGGQLRCTAGAVSESH